MVIWNKESTYPMGLERIRRVSPVMPATPARIYAAWLNSAEHSKFTGSEANMSTRTGGSFTAQGGYITGENVELEKGERIVQTWRTSDFPDEAEDSEIEISFKETETGTRVIINHRGIPEGLGERYHKGWGERYFKPMVRYFISNPSQPASAARRDSESPSNSAASRRGARRKSAGGDTDTGDDSTEAHSAAADSEPENDAPSSAKANPRPTRKKAAKSTAKRSSRKAPEPKEEEEPPASRKSVAPSKKATKKSASKKPSKKASKRGGPRRKPAKTD